MRRDADMAMRLFLESQERNQPELVFQVCCALFHGMGRRPQANLTSHLCPGVVGGFRVHHLIPMYPIVGGGPRAGLPIHVCP